MSKKKVVKNLIVGLDIGTSKVVSVVAEVLPDKTIEIVGIGSHPSRGLKRGVVVNIESTVQSIQRAIEESEVMAGCQIHAAYTGIAGSHIRSLNSHGIVAIREREVAQSDVDRVIDAARAVAIPADQKILHVLPQEFIIDSQQGIREPIGMSGVRLESKVHIVTSAISASQNIEKCVKRCGLEIGDIILEQLAASQAVLSEDEKELGVCILDIGAGTTDIAIFTQGAIRHTIVIPIGGDQVTNDIAISLRTSPQHAETLKTNYGSALADLVADSETIMIEPVGGERGGQSISRKMLANIIEARYEELLKMILTELKNSGHEESLASGIVITGGAARTPGLIELTEKILKRPVRLGLPQYVSGMTDVLKNPALATSIGLILHGFSQQQEGASLPTLQSGVSVRGLFGRMRSWFQGNF